MNKEEIRRALAEAGACAVGFAVAGEVEQEAREAFDRWLDRGFHAGMEYMRNHKEIRRDPRLLLPGARTVISLAFRYPQAPEGGSGLFASYSLGLDYHDVLRARLREAVAHLPEEGDYRICVDSAPIAERYWARKAGIGFIADNGALTVPGIGNRIFLAEIVTTLEIEPDREYPLARGCGSCGACRRVCPTAALQREPAVSQREQPSIQSSLQREHPSLQSSLQQEPAALQSSLQSSLQREPAGAQREPVGSNCEPVGARPSQRSASVIDCHRCLSYLTIEHRGEWEDPRQREALAEAKRKGALPIFGCDRCIRICPHNRSAASSAKGAQGAPSANGNKGEAKGEKCEKGDLSAKGEKGEKCNLSAKGEKGEKCEKDNLSAKGEKSEKGDLSAKGEKSEKGAKGGMSEKCAPSAKGILPELLPREEIAGLTAADCLALSQEEFSRLFRGSPVKRAKLAGLQRNARLICLELKF